MVRIILTLLLICAPIWSQGLRVLKVRKANPSIIIKAPCADETVRKGSNYTIRWEVKQQGPTSDVSIQLIDTSGKKRVYKLNRIANNGSYLWKVSPSISNGDYRIIIFFEKPGDGGSSGKFKIRPMIENIPRSTKMKTLPRPIISIAVTNPEADMTWEQNQSYTIKWNKFGQLPDKVKIVLKPTGNGTRQVIKNTAPNSGFYQWSIPGSIRDGKYKIKVKVVNTKINDFSDEFRIGKKFKVLHEDLRDRPITVKQPKKDHWYAPKAKVPIEWETKVLNYLPANNMLYFTIDLYDQDRKDKIHTIAGPDRYDKYYLGNDRYYFKWPWSPYNGNTAVKTGFYKIKISAKFADKDPVAMPGFSGKIHLSRGVEEVIHTLYPQIRNRNTRRSYLVGLYPAGTPIFENSYPDEWKNQPGLARVGYYHHRDRENRAFIWYGQTDCWVFRSQMTFSVQKNPGTILVEALLILTVKNVDMKVTNNQKNSCGGKLYVPSAPWSGRCIETPAGELLGLVPDEKYIAFNVTHIVKDWMSGARPNHGFLMTSCDESLTHPDATENHLYCLSFYKPELRLKFVSGK